MTDRDDQEDAREGRATSLHGLCRSHVRMLFAQPPVDADRMPHALLAAGFRTSVASLPAQGGGS